MKKAELKKYNDELNVEVLKMFKQEFEIDLN